MFILPLIALIFAVPAIVSCADANTTQWSNICLKNEDCTTESNNDGINGTLKAFCHGASQCLCNRFALNVQLNDEFSQIEQQFSCTNCSDFLSGEEGTQDPCTVQDLFSACNNNTGYCECTINITHWKATAKQIKLENVLSQSEKASKSICLNLHVKAHLNATVILDDIRKMFESIDWDWLVTLIFCYTLPILALLLFFWFMYTHICAVEETTTEPVLYHQL